MPTLDEYQEHLDRQLDALNRELDPLLERHAQLVTARGNLAAYMIAQAPAPAPEPAPIPPTDAAGVARRCPKGEGGPAAPSAEKPQARKARGGRGGPAIAVSSLEEISIQRAHGVPWVKLARSPWFTTDGDRRRYTDTGLRNAFNRWQSGSKSKDKVPPPQAPAEARRAKEGPVVRRGHIARADRNTLAEDIAITPVVLPPLELGDNPAEYLTAWSVAAIRALLNQGMSWNKIHHRLWKFQDGKARKIPTARLRSKYEAQITTATPAPVE